MRLLFITQKIDEQDDDLGFVTLWIQEFIRQGFEVEVICLEKRNFSGRYPVYSLGKEEGKSRIQRTARFLKLLVTLRYDRVFVHMNSEYYTVGGWWWWLCGIPTYLWYTHYTLPFHTRIAGLVAKRMFAATEQSLPQFRGNPKRVITGHGIDLSFWKNRRDVSEKLDEHHLLAVHRICRSKRIDLAIRMLALLPATYTLTIYGRDIEKDYVRELSELVRTLGIETRVTFKGPVAPRELPAIYAHYGMLVNMAWETVDKTMLEAMVYGLYPVVSKSTAEAIGLPHSPNSDEPRDIADFIVRGAWRTCQQNELRNIVAKRHSLEGLVQTMGSYIRDGR